MTKALRIHYKMMNGEERVTYLDLATVVEQFQDEIVPKIVRSINEFKEVVESEVIDVQEE